eukprot:scaffold168627_cov82-Attheya_sp.AAC.2
MSYPKVGCQVPSHPEPAYSLLSVYPLRELPFCHDDSIRPRSRRSHDIRSRSLRFTKTRSPFHPALPEWFDQAVTNTTIYFKTVNPKYVTLYVSHPKRFIQRTDPSVKEPRATGETRKVTSSRRSKNNYIQPIRFDRAASLSILTSVILTLLLCRDVYPQEIRIYLQRANSHTSLS